MRNRFEWLDTCDGPQLWDHKQQCWILWYKIGAIGIDASMKLQISDALNILDGRTYEEYPP